MYTRIAEIDKPSSKLNVAPTGYQFILSKLQRLLGFIVEIHFEGYILFFKWKQDMFYKK